MNRTSLGLLLVALTACSVEQPTGWSERFAQRRELLTVSETPIGTEAPGAALYNTGDYIALAGSGDEQMLVFWDGNRIPGQRDGADGTLHDLDAWPKLGRNDADAGDQSYPNLAYGADTYLTLYSDGSDAKPDLHAQTISATDGAIGDLVLVDAKAGYASAVFNGTDFHRGLLRW